MHPWQQQDKQLFYNYYKRTIAILILTNGNKIYTTWLQIEVLHPQGNQGQFKKENL